MVYYMYHAYHGNPNSIIIRSRADNGTLMAEEENNGMHFSVAAIIGLVTQGLIEQISPWCNLLGIGNLYTTNRDQNVVRPTHTHTQCHTAIKFNYNNTS